MASWLFDASSGLKNLKLTLVRTEFLGQLHPRSFPLRCTRSLRLQPAGSVRPEALSRKASGKAKSAALSLPKASCCGQHEPFDPHFTFSQPAADLAC